MKRKLFYKRRRCQCEDDSFIVAEEKPSFLGRIFSGSASGKKRRKFEGQEENSSTVQLRRLLRMDFRITIWDMDSTTLAKQLTLIDRDLFVRIPTEEIEILVFQRGSKNAPNLAAWIAFSHRISCLAVSEVLAVKKLDIRGRIIARLINAASKCFAMGNFHSCRSILSGLQAPPIYRLRRSWSYLRTHHANRYAALRKCMGNILTKRFHRIKSFPHFRYETMERLCKLYKSPCSLAYQRAWSKAERSPPCLPYVGDLFARLLGLGNIDRQRDCHPLCHIKEAVRQQSLNNVESTNLSNKHTYCVSSNENLEVKQGLGRRILASVFNRVKYKKDETTIYEEKADPSWTSREQDLAWKYFYRWNNAVLKRKALVKQEERFRDMDPRLRRVLEVASWLTDCQRWAQGYDIPGHSFTREFLLKTRYREDRENFFISLKLEPSKIT